MTAFDPKRSFTGNGFCAILTIRKAHSAFIVENPPALEVALRAGGCVLKGDRLLEGYRRIFVDDSFGALLEIVEPA